MRSAAATALCGLLLNIGLAQVKPTPSLRPTRLEAFAGQPSSRITWSKEVGRLERPEARAVVTALVVENPLHCTGFVGALTVSVQGARIQIPWLQSVTFGRSPWSRHGGIQTALTG